MNIKMKLDALDLKILQALQQNARVTIFELSRQLGVSRPTVRGRIEKLQEGGVIKKFTVIIDRDAIRGSIIMLLRMKADNLKEVVRRLKKFDEILEIYQTIGERNLACKAVVQDTNGLKNLLGRIGELDVSAVESSIVLKTLKEEFETKVGPEIGVSLKCEYCGNEIFATPYKFKIHNVEHYFCCPVCLKNFKYKSGRVKAL